MTMISFPFILVALATSFVLVPSSLLADPLNSEFVLQLPLGPREPSVNGTKDPLFIQASVSSRSLLRARQLVCLDAGYSPCQGNITLP